MLSTLRLLWETNERSGSDSKAQLEDLRLGSLSILDKLNQGHQLHTSNVQREEKRDEVRASQWKELSSKIDALTDMGGRLATERRILDSLCYKSMRARHDRVAHAHANTFEWIFNSESLSSDHPNQNSFTNWLSCGSGLYWITGKAGSGKSTLMKFLVGHPSTSKALDVWRDTKELIQASFFFWYAGTELQKAQEGLLQSLLHEILWQCRSLMPLVLPRRWEECRSTNGTSTYWPRDELIAAFTELSKQSAISKRFCFFIDGLDEYGGDARELIDLIQGFAFSDHLKFCVSSRPWNVFEAAFGSDTQRKLQVEDLTHDDIKLYVENILEHNRLFCQMRMKEPRRCDDLLNEVVDKAQGVFLWVYLVVHSLREGLTNADRISDLQRRLRALPSDLETYFRHMLTGIDDVYAEQTAQTFRVALEASEPLTLMTYAMLDEIEENPAFAMDLKVREKTQSEIHTLHKDMKQRINARCKDLLVVSRVSKNPISALEMNEARLTPRPLEAITINHMPDIVGASEDNHSYKTIVFRGNLSSNPFFEYEVDVLHRTVRDFLRVEDVRDGIMGRTSKDFNPNQSLCKAFLAQIKTVPLRPNQLVLSGPLSDLVDDMTHYAAAYQWQSGSAPTNLLDELALTMSERNRIGGPISLSNPSGLDRSLRQIRQSFLGYAVQKDLGLYVQAKLDERPPPVVDSSIIIAALNPSVTSKYGIKDCADDSMASLLARLLVESGVECQNSLGVNSNWSVIIAGIISQWSSMTVEAKATQLRMLTLLLDAGADPGYDEVALQWVEIVLMPLGNWQGHGLLPSDVFEGPDPKDRYHRYTRLLSKFIESVFEHGTEISHDRIYKGKTLWNYLITAIWNSQSPNFIKATPRLKAYLSARDEMVQIVIIFLRSGASLDGKISGIAPRPLDIAQEPVRSEVRSEDETSEQGLDLSGTESEDNNKEEEPEEKAQRAQHSDLHTEGLTSKREIANESCRRWLGALAAEERLIEYQDGDRFPPPSYLSATSAPTCQLSAREVLESILSDKQMEALKEEERSVERDSRTPIDQPLPPYPIDRTPVIFQDIRDRIRSYRPV